MSGGRARESVVVPARNEAATVGAVVAMASDLADAGVVDEVVVVDDGSSDETAFVASAAGAKVVASTGGPGKGQALRAGVAATTGELLVFLDADVAEPTPRFVTALLEPLRGDAAVRLVKARYRRPCDGRPDEGGRVTELLAKPLLRRLAPELAAVDQPRAGEVALRRSVLEDDGIELADGYGVEIGLLLDVHRRHGLTAIAQADLGERVHRNHHLHDLRPHADQVLAAVLERFAVPSPPPPRSTDRRPS